MEDFRTPDELFRDQTEKMKRAGENYGRYIPYAVIGIILLAALFSSFYTIAPDEVGVIQRFGRYVRQSQPGLHMKIPLGIEEVTPVKVRKIFKQEFGFRTARPGVRSTYSRQDYMDESLILTGDLNILDVRWVVQFRIIDPEAFLFNTRDPFSNVRDMSEVVMRRLCGDYTVDEVLTIKRKEVSHKADLALQKLMDKFGTGIRINTVKLLDVNPPDRVKPAFNEVNEAKQEMEQMINEAWEKYNTEIPRAKGEAKQTIQEAEGYQLEKVNRARGEAERFRLTRQAYEKAPRITKKRLYLETMTDILSRTGRKFITDPGQQSILPLLKLDEEVKGDTK